MPECHIEHTQGSSKDKYKKNLNMPFEDYFIFLFIYFLNYIWDILLLTK